MYILPIRRAKVREIIEIADVTRNALDDEASQYSRSTDHFWAVFEKSYEQNIPPIQSALYEAVTGLSPDEQAALCAIAIVGRDSDENGVSDEWLRDEIERPSYGPSNAAHLVEMLYLADYLRRGLDVLDERVR